MDPLPLLFDPDVLPDELSELFPPLSFPGELPEPLADPVELPETLPLPWLPPPEDSELAEEPVELPPFPLDSGLLPLDPEPLLLPLFPEDKLPPLLPAPLELG